MDLFPEIPVYITHLSTLVERKELLSSTLLSLGITPIWVEREDIPLNFYNPEPSLWKSKLEVSYPCDSTPSRRLRDSELSIGIKQYECWVKAASLKTEFVLILEDDVLLQDNFIINFNSFLKSTPPDWDIIFIGEGCNLHVPNPNPSIVAYPVSPPRTRCLDSYLIKRTLCDELSKSILPITLPIDFEVTYALVRLQSKCYWWEPILTTQGSQMGRFPSAIQLNE
tara:strand:- start:11715 stop:12389 length:675 start_codon:yes stop_codon:yes gene_type:complete